MNLLYGIEIRMGVFYLTSVKPALGVPGLHDRLTHNSLEERMYFQAGRDELTVNCPTHFRDFGAAVAAAEQMGFIVLGQPVLKSSLS